jgi:hypothetical protein
LMAPLILEMLARFLRQEPLRMGLILIIMERLVYM